MQVKGKRAVAGSVELGGRSSPELLLAVDSVVVDSVDGAAARSVAQNLYQALHP